MNLRHLLVLLCLAGLLPACSPEEPELGAPQAASIPAEARRAAPAFKLPLLEGGSLSLAEFKGKPTVLVFTTTWCPHCVDAIPEWKRLHQTYRTQGVGFAAIYIQESPAKVKAFARKHRLPYPVALDADGAIAQAYGVRGVPTQVLITPAGQTYKNPSWNLAADLEALLARP